MSVSSFKGHRQGDKEARNYLVQENIGLVKHIVSRYTARGVEKRRFISDRDDRASEGH